MQTKNKKRIPFGSTIKSKVYEFLHYGALSPHPQKMAKGGEDALFTSKNIIVIADGVGSWKDFGIDAGIYSKNLILIIQDLIQDEQKLLYYIQHPQKLASAAVNLNKAQGSTTLSILTLHPNTGILRTYHIGDSIYGIFKQNGDRILGLQQQYIFNHPYQVGSNFFNRQSNQEMEFCNPECGIYNQFNFSQIGDSHIVLASDGIWDNLYTQNMQKILHDSKLLQQQNTFSRQLIRDLIFSVERIINTTLNTYQINNYESPFYQKAREVGLNVGRFAKVDDLALIVARVVQKNITQ